VIADRLQEYIAELVSAAVERAVTQGNALVYFAEWLYQVETVHPGSPVTYDLRSTDPRLPDLQGIALWPGPSGASAQAVAGSQVRVRFANADRTRPMIVGLDPNAVDVVTAPANTSIVLAGGGAAVGRVNDAVTITNAISGTVSGATCTITKVQFDAAQPFISTGSGKVSSG
jgi:hypothetical protein